MRINQALGATEERLHILHREPGFGRIVVGHRQIPMVDARARSAAKLGSA
jgi:hypothetical protein